VGFTQITMKLSPMMTTIRIPVHIEKLHKYFDVKVQGQATDRIDILKTSNRFNRRAASCTNSKETHQARLNTLL